MKYVFNRLLTGALLAAALAPSNSHAIAVDASDDTYVRPSVAMTVGTKRDLRIGSAADFRSLVKFDLSHLPAGAEGTSVTKATMRVYFRKVWSGGNLQVRPIEGDWSETLLHSGNGIVYGSGHSTYMIDPLDSNKFKLFDVTDLVRDWIDHPQSNFGVAFESVDGLYARLDSKDGKRFGQAPTLDILMFGDGDDGLTGPAGPQGPQGPAGANGATGSQGPAGPQGPVGNVGPQGPQGLVGPQGAAGPQGAVGPQGPAGAEGAVGPQGLQGPAGADGAVGAQGPQGPAGADGAVGPQGPAGADGAVGPQGPAGADGATGPQGLEGPAGPQGPAGAEGATGPQGLPGPQGPAGLDGAPGPQGPAGADGATGQEGPAGPAGPQGPMGPQGLPGGQVGTDGATGTSVTLHMVPGNMVITGKPTLVTIATGPTFSGFTSKSTYTVTLSSTSATTTGNGATSRILNGTQFEVYGNNGEGFNYVAIGY